MMTPLKSMATHMKESGQSSSRLQSGKERLSGKSKKNSLGMNGIENFSTKTEMKCLIMMIVSATRSQLLNPHKK